MIILSCFKGYINYNHWMYRLFDIQGDSGGICNTLRNDSMCDSKQKVHINMGPILNGYGVMGIF